MAKPRKILHLDLDAFFCAVEEQYNPDLRGKAIAVGGQPGQRGVVASASYPARAYGVRSAMPTAQALRLCPHLILVGSRHGVYGERSKAVMAILRETAPDVEELSIDDSLPGCDHPARADRTDRAQIAAAHQQGVGLALFAGRRDKQAARQDCQHSRQSGQAQASPAQCHHHRPARRGEAAFLAPLAHPQLVGRGTENRRRLWPRWDCAQSAMVAKLSEDGAGIAAGQSGSGHLAARAGHRLAPRARRRASQIHQQGSYLPRRHRRRNKAAAGSAAGCRTG